MLVLKRWIAVITAAALLLCAVPLSAFATEEATDAAVPVSVNTSVQDDTLDIDSLTADDIVGELTELREANVKHFMLTDGSTVAVSYPLGVHEQVDGEWQEIDNTLADATDADGDEVLQNAAQNVQFSFVKGQGNGRLVKIADTRSQAQVIVELENAQKKNLTVSEAEDSDELFALDRVVQRGVYTDILPDTDIEYIIAGTSLKENIIFKTASSAGDVRFLLRCKNVTATLCDDQSVMLCDADGNEVFTIPAPFMYDAAGAYSDAVTVTLEETNKGYTYTMTPDSAWLADSSRVYPVTLDPMVEVLSSAVEEHDAVWAKAEQNLSVLRSYLPVGTYNGYETGALIYMALPSGITNSSRIISASLRAYRADGFSRTQVKKVNAYQYGSEWDFEENQISTSGEPPVVGNVLDYVDFPANNTTQGEVAFDITEAVQRWTTTHENYGILLRGATPEQTMMFYSHNFGAHVPSVIYHYRDVSGVEDYWTYTAVPAGIDGAVGVNNYTGDLLYTQPIITDTESDYPVDLTWYYSSSTTSGRFVAEDYLNVGLGGRTNYHLRILSETETTPYYIVDADGTKHAFVEVVDETTAQTTLIDEDNIGYELTAQQTGDSITGYVVIDPYEQRLNFDAGGYLTSIVGGENAVITIEREESSHLITTVSNGQKTLQFSYMNHLGTQCVRSVQDGEDVYSFTYNAHCLTSITYPNGDVIAMSYVGNASYMASISTSRDALAVTAAYHTVERNDVILARTAQLSYGTADQLGVRYHFNYGNNTTDITVGAEQNAPDARTATYLFNNYGHTVGVINQNTKQAQYYEFGAPGGVNAQELGTANELLAASGVMRANVNYLQNPHMTVGQSNAWDEVYTNADQSASVDWNDGMGHSDFESAMFSQYGNNAGGMWLQQTVTGLTAGAYTASAYVSTDGNVLSGSGAVIKAERLSDGVVTATAYSQHVTKTESYEWVRLAVSLDVVQGDAVRISVGTADANGIFFADDLCFEEGETPTTFNLLTNSSFHNGLASWSGHAFTDSTQSALISLADAPAYLSQTVTLNPALGNYLSFGGWAKAASVSTDDIGGITALFTKEHQPTFELRVEFVNEDNALLTDKTVAVRFNDAVEEWQFACGGAEIPASAVSCRFECRYDYNIGLAYIDDLFLKQQEFTAYRYTVSEDESTEETPYDYTNDRTWYSYLSAEQASNGVTTHSQVSQTVAGSVATSVEAGVNYYIINAATGEALYAPEAAANEQVYLRPIDASDNGYVWTLSTPSSGATYQFCKASDSGARLNMAFSSNTAILVAYGTSLSYQLALNANGDGSFELETGASYGAKNLDVDYTVDTNDPNLTAVVQKAAATNSDTQKWLFVPCGNNAYIETSSTFDENGNMLTATDERGNVTSYTYDASGNMIGETDAKGNLTSYLYDSEGNRVMAKNGNAMVTFTYQNGAVTQIDKDNTATSGGNVGYAFSSDVFGRPTSTTVGATATERQSLAAFAYNARNLLSTLTYGNGTTVNYTYNDLDLLTSIAYNGSGASFAFAYDDQSRLTLKKDYVSNRRTRYSYDDDGNVAEMTVTSGASADGGAVLLEKEVVDTYSANGTLIRVNGTDAVEQLVHYDDNGQVTGLSARGETTVTYTFDEFGRLTARNLATDTARNAAVTYYGVGSDSRTTNLVKYYNNGVTDYGYYYDVNGQITSVNEGAVVQSFGYDALGQMTYESNRRTNTNTHYAYDNGGNLLQKTIYPSFTSESGTPTVITYEYANTAWADQLTKYNGETISYDAAGNPLNWRDGAALAWKNGRELSSYIKGGTAATYDYNENGIRTQKIVNGVKTSYILDENDLLVGEVKGTSTLVFLYDEYNTAYGFLYNDTPYYYLFNAQGDVVQVVNQAGASVATYAYDAWGKIIAKSGTMATVNPLRYRGYYYDEESGYYYLQTRYYDPVVGRFLNADDTFDENYELIGYNLYTYTRNSPMNFSDPTGRYIALFGKNPSQQMFLLRCLQELTTDILYTPKLKLGEYLKKDDEENNYPGLININRVYFYRYSSYTRAKPAGTRLIRELINSSYGVCIYLTIDLNPKTNSECNIGVDKASVFLDPSNIRVNTPGGIVLGHELIHAYRYMQGIHISSKEEYPYRLSNGKMNEARMEELLTTGIYSPYVLQYQSSWGWVSENVLRRENGLVIRTNYSSLP